MVLLAMFLPVYSYLALIYRELGRMTTGPVHEHLDIFEAEIELKINLNRRSAGRAFRILGHFWLAFLVLETTRGVYYFVPGTWESVIELVAFIALEVMIARPDIVAIAASATLEELHAKLTESSFTKLPVYENSLDDIQGVVYSRDLLQVADTDFPKRHVRELMKPVLFMPETKIGS